MDKKDLKQFGRIGVLMGGCSSEKEISLKSGKAVLTALVDEGMDAVAVLIDSEEAAVNKQVLADSGIRLGFIAMHGRYGEDGGMQTVLDEMDIPYAGSGPAASRRAMNKIVTQTALKEAGLPVADFCVLEKGCSNVVSHVENIFHGAAVVVKPAAEGSSIGICIVDDYARLDAAVQAAFHYGDQVLVERFIKGRELTVGILGDKALPIVEIKTACGFFDFEAKYQKGKTEYLVPAHLDDKIAERIKTLSLEAFCTMGCRDFSRVDVLLADEKKPYILEINTIPGFTATSLLPMAAKSAGCDFAQLCVKLMLLALERYEHKGERCYG